jgi:hypothetical protein
MGRLKPIGSEKLEGQAKINRMLEIARFNENIPSNLNETARSEYDINLADGNKYEIVKERQGYIIKRMISESQSEYIEPMKNRKYYSSYSQAFKRLNLLAGELNRLNENEEGISLFGEQKKFVLRTPKPAPQDIQPEPAAPAPPPVPSPELPPSPVGDEGGIPDMGGDEMIPPSDDMGGDEMMPPSDDMGMEGPDNGEQVSFRTIQKLTGKLTQKIRVLDSEEGMTSEDIKYVINMVLSSLDLKSLSEEDKEDILGKFEEDSESEEFGMEDITSDTEVEDIQSDMDIPVDSDEGEMAESFYEGIFAESKVDKVLSKYFELTKKEILEHKNKRQNRLQERKHIAKKKMNEVMDLCETIEQELASHKFLEENANFHFIGKTNKKNLIFEKNGEQRKITPKGFVI